MIALSIQFLAGRYHATPWGRHVNEGVPEWPPSPWRILRAIVYSWKRTMPSLDEEKVRKILFQLCEPPFFRLPPAALGHTRHFMPWDKEWLKKREASRTMVFNTFVVVGKDDPLIVYWPDAELDDEHKNVLKKLVSNISYLGRSESWCRIDVVDVSEYSEDSFNVKPLKDRSCDEGYEAVSVLVPSSSIDFTKPLNEDHSLLVRTTVLRRGLRRIDPPGAVWVEYARPRECLEPRIPVEGGRLDRKPVKVIRYLLDGNVLPRVLETITVASVARAAAMSVYGGSTLRKSPVLSGKNEVGEPLKGHGHTFYLPSDEDGDGKLDHLTLFAPMGFDEEHRAVLGSLNRLYGYGLSSELRLLLLGMQEEPSFSIGSWLFGPSEVWESETPFLLFRHPKVTGSKKWRVAPLPSGLKISMPESLGRYSSFEHLLIDYGVLPDLSSMQIDGPLSQLLLECKRRGLPRLVEVTFVPELKRPRFIYRWIEFKRYRRGLLKPVLGYGFGFKLRFEEPLMGPLALGYGCHYGLGLFRRVA